MNIEKILLNYLKNVRIGHKIEKILLDYLKNRKITYKIISNHPLFVIIEDEKHPIDFFVLYKSGYICLYMKNNFLKKMAQNENHETELLDFENDLRKLGYRTRRKNILAIY